MKNNQDTAGQSQKSKIIRLKPEIESKGELELINSVANMLGEINDKISQHYEDQAEDANLHSEDKGKQSD